MTKSVLSQIAELKEMTASQLQSRWKELFGNTPTQSDRNYLRRKLAYRIQELAFGGDPTIEERLEALAKRGRTEHKRKTTASIYLISGSMIMTTDQWNDLVDFFQNTIKEAAPFNLPEPGNDAAGTLTVVFSGPPSRQYFSPGRWTVSLKFEVQP